MKKLILILISLLMFTGCVSEGKTDINNKDEVIYTIGDDKLVREDIYNLMLSQVGYAAVLDNALKFIYEKEVVLDENDNKKIEEEFNEMKANYNAMWEDILLQSGFADEQAFKDTIIERKKEEKLNSKFVTEKFDHYTSLYNPKYIQYMTFTDIETAEKALADIKAGVDFKEVATTHSASGNKEEHVYTNVTSLPFDIKTFIDVATGPITSEIIANVEPATPETSTSPATEEKTTYYIVNVIDTDNNNFKDEFISAVGEIQETTDEMLKHYYDLYNFKVYNEEIKSYIDGINPGFLD